MKKRLLRSAFVLAAFCFFLSSSAQSRLYPMFFDLEDVTITDGPFLEAQQLNETVLMKYSSGRLLQPYEKQAGLKESGAEFSNWGGDRGLDGHIGGHYMSALAMAYASERKEATKKKILQRLNKFVDRLKECQDAWDAHPDPIMHGYCGGMPHSYDVWSTFAKGDMSEYWASWVPFYNIHKTYAGLRDAWVYTGNETAKTVFLKFCDWGLNLISGLSDSQLQGALGQEHGGINEMFADAYQMTGDDRYLNASKRLAHKWLLQAMGQRNGSVLNNVHGNTQVPKVIGFERTYQQDGTRQYGNAAKFFWQNVTGERTIAIGGNSVSEWFPDEDHYDKFINSSDGVESCNSNNMLKLTEALFCDDHKSEYADFFEGTLYNHILSTQHPETGGYVYFTSARPQHYRVYSQINKAMWCCVGTGMENHSKYAQFVYVHDGDNLYVNLFMPTNLKWKEKGVELTQTTAFPYEPKTTITINAGGDYTMMMRHPAWADGFTVKVNGEQVVADEVNGYLPIKRQWKEGDVVEVALPMKISVVPLQHYTDYVAFKYGPILLGAKTGTDGLDGLFADESRMGHVAWGEQKHLYSAPLLIGSRDKLAEAIVPLDLSALKFKIEGYYSDNKWSDLVLEPFNTIHEARYMMYWLNVEGEKWQAIQDELQAAEDAAHLLELRTLDFVDTGTQQSESDHFMEKSGSSSGSHKGEYWRDGSMFSYLLQTRGKSEGVTLMVRYWGADSGNRSFDIYIDDTVIASESLKGGPSEFVNVEYPVPATLLEGKSEVRVKFQAKPGNIAGGVFYLRLLMSAEDAGIGTVTVDKPTQHIYYDLQGRPVQPGSNMPRGIYIIDGKAVLK